MKKAILLAATITACCTLTAPSQAQPLPDCELPNVSAQVSECDENGNYHITFGPFSSADLAAWNVTFSQAENPDCQQTFFVETPDCTAPDCVIENPTVVIGDCHSDGTFYIHLDFEHENTNAFTFVLGGSAAMPGNFAYDDLPLQLGPYEGNGANYVLEIVDSENNGCFAVAEFTAPNCTTPECVIDEVTATPGECNADGLFYISLDFEHENTGNDGFSVAGNGNQYGNFAYGDLPITLGPFEGDGTTHYEFVVRDLQDNDCSDFTELGTVDCSPEGCHIYDLEVDTDVCNPDGTYDIWLDFEHENTAGLGFDLWTGDGPVGFYSYDDLPLVIHNFGIGDGQGVYLGVSENDLESCFDAVEFIAPNCTTPECVIENPTVVIGDCHSDGTFYIHLDFEHENTNAFTFVLGGSAAVPGNFAYDDLPLQLGPYAGSGSNYVLEIVDSENNGCFAVAEFTAPDCSSSDCMIDGVTATPGECNADGLFYVILDFVHQNTGNDGFSVAGNGNQYGNFAYGDLPITLGPFNGENAMVYEFVVHDIQIDGCSAVGLTEWDGCTTPECVIDEVTATPSECNADGLFYVILDFEHENTGNDGFSVTGNGNQYGNFAYGDLPITLGPFEGNGTTHYEFVVRDLQDNDCSDFTELGTVDCSPEGCHIYDLEVDTDVCNPDGTYDIWLDFEHENTAGLGFDLWTGDGPVGFYSYDQLPLVIHSFAVGDGQGVYLGVSENDLESCFDAVEFIAPDCTTPECVIDEVTATPGECNADGLFYVTLDFVHQNTGNDGFSVAGNGNQYGNFAYGDLPITLGPFEGNGTTHYEFVVRDLQDNDCSDFTELGTVNCTPDECHIYDLVVDTDVCNPDGTYDIWLDFEHENTAGLGFDLWTGDGPVGFYSYDELPLAIHSFAVGDGQGVYLGVSENDLESCFDAVEFIAPDCPTGVANNSGNGAGLFLHPIPANNRVEVVFEPPASMGGTTPFLKVFDTSGRLMFQSELSGNRLWLDVAHYPSGMYMLRLEYEGGYVSSKLAVD